MKRDGYNTSLITCEGMDALIKFLPYFNHSPENFGEEASVIDACAFPASFSHQSLAFIDLCYQYNFVQDFDWGKWADNRARLVSSGEGIEALDLADIGRLLTVHCRGDRFCDGHLMGVMKTGRMTRIIERLKILNYET